MHPRVAGLMAATLFLAGGLFGCTNPAGASQLPTIRVSYNEAIARSSSEQLLLNIVRLRYLHTPQFFEVTSVTTQGTVRGGLGGGLTGTIGEPANTPPNFIPNVLGTYEWEESPTISYEPLQGQEFAQRMVSPIAAETVMQLVQVGWRIDNILACCVHRVNGLSAPIIASRDPSFGGEDFLRLARELYDLQIHQVLEIDLVRRGEDSPTEVYMVFAPTHDARLREEVADVQRLMGLDPTRQSYRVYSSDDPMILGQRDAEEATTREGAASEGSGDHDERDDDERDEPPAADAAAPRIPTPPAGGLDRVVLRGRSLLGTMFYLSHGVTVPDGDRGARSLDYEDGERGAVRPGNPIPNPLLSIRSDPTEGIPYVSTTYRGHRFVVDDEDLEAKQTFLLMSILFSLLSQESQGGPVLTLPVGN